MHVARRVAAVLALLAGAAGLVAFHKADNAPPDVAPGVCEPGPKPPATPANGRRLYVSPTGSDAAPGTLRRPLRSLQTALDRLRPGDTLFLRAGTYDGYLYLRRDGTSDRPIVVRGYPGEQPIVQGRLRIDASHVVVSHLIFDQSGGTLQDVAVFVNSGVGDWIAYNEIRKSSYSGVLVGDGTVRLSIVGNWIHDDGDNIKWDHGVYWAGGNGGLLAQNVIDDNVGYGVQLYPNADHIVVRRNTVVRNGRSGIIVGGNASETSDSNLIVGNVVASNGELGIRTFWDGPVGTGNVARANLVYDNPQGAVGGGGLARTENVQANPRFPSVADRDFRVGIRPLARRFGAQLDVRCIAENLPPPPARRG